MSLNDVQDGSAEIGVTGFTTGANLALPLNVSAIASNRYWQITVNNGSLSASGASLYVPGSSIDASQKLVVVQADDANGAMSINLGGGTSGDFVSSFSPVTKPILTIGVGEEVDLQIHDLITPFNGDLQNDQLHIANVEFTSENKVTLLDRWGVVVKQWNNFRNYDDTANPNDDGFDFSKPEPWKLYLCVGISAHSRFTKTRTKSHDHRLKRKLMNRILQIFFLIGISSSLAAAQDIPLFSQKLTNSFIYNPSLAGHTFGSITYSYRQNYSNVQGAPRSNFISMHTPFANHKMGIGVNLFQEDVNFVRNTHASIAGAYHLHFNRYNILSVGVSGEYDISRLNGSSNTIGVNADPVLRQLQTGNGTYDFSFGANYQTRYLKAGFALNRLGTAWLNKETSNLSNYYSGYVQGLIPVRGGDDLLEPYVAFRKFSESNNTYDIGLFYTYNNKILGGVAVRRSNVINGTIGFKFFKHATIGYSREMITSALGGFVGAANEITIRLDFNDETYKERFKADYKNAMSFRRKTLSAPRSFLRLRNQETNGVNWCLIRLTQGIKM